MFKKILGFTMAMLLLVAPCAYSSVAVQDDGVYEGEAVTINFVNNSVTFDGTTATVGSDITYDSVPLAMRAWGNVSYEPMGSTAAPSAPNGADYLLTTAHLDTGTTIASPYYYFTDSYADFIVFPGLRVTTNQAIAAQNGSPMEYTFRVKDNYSTTGRFVIVCKNSHVNDSKAGAATANRIDWDIVINRAGSAVSSTRYDLDSVTLTATTDLQTVLLTYATPTDFVAGDIVTVRIWREWGALGTAKTHPTADTTYYADATSDLYIYNSDFQYAFAW